MQETTEKIAFSQRLNEICDEMGITQGRGRQMELARVWGITGKGARKWLVGEGFPEMDLCIQIAKWASVSYEWLMTGRGPKRGNLVDTKALVLNELLNDMPELSRQMTFDFIQYQITKPAAPLFVGEKLSRYMSMIDNFKKDRLKDN